LLALEVLIIFHIIIRLFYCRFSAYLGKLSRLSHIIEDLQASFCDLDLLEVLVLSLIKIIEPTFFVINLQLATELYLKLFAGIIFPIFFEHYLQFISLIQLFIYSILAIHFEVPLVLWNF
jgi:hypothetical protein